MKYWRVWMVLVLLVASASCGPETVLEISTVVYSDRSASRSAALYRVIPEGTKPPVPTIEKALRLSFWDEDGWRVHHLSADRIEASTHQVSVESLPAGPRRTDQLMMSRNAPDFQAEDFILFSRYRWSERYGDPLGTEQIEETIQNFTLWFEGFLTRQLQLEGVTLEPGLLKAWVSEQVTPLLRSLVYNLRTLPRGFFDPNFEQVFMTTLRSQDLPIVAYDDQDLDLWMDAQLVEILNHLDKSLERSIALDASTSLAILTTALEQAGEYLDFVVEDPCPTEQGWNETCQLIQSAMGTFSSPEYEPLRFEFKTKLPGTLIRTNGTLIGDTVMWIYRAHEFTVRDQHMQAISLQLNPEALTTLGAPRQLETERLLQLDQLFKDREQADALKALIEKAIAAQDFYWWRDKEQVPETWQTAAMELANLLDPKLR